MTGKYIFVPMKSATYLYTVYVALIFLFSAVLFLPIQILLGQFRNAHRAALSLNFIWANIFMTLGGFRPKVHYDVPLAFDGQYIFCANHFSFFDIPAMGLLPIPFKFIGKASITKVPIFGYMFQKLHIAVNRDNIKDRAASVKKSAEAIAQGYSMVFFPEGGIKSTSPPEMVPFKDGAFRLAVEYQLPIVPVTLKTTYQIFPDDGTYRIFPFPLIMHVHAPIFPLSKKDEEVKRLKSETFTILMKSLNSYVKSAED